MSSRNITLQLDGDTIEQAKALANKQGMSMSGFLAHQVQLLTEADQRYERARQSALALMEDAVNSKRIVPRWSREELYDRPQHIQG